MHREFCDFYLKGRSVAQSRSHGGRAADDRLGAHGDGGANRGGGGLGIKGGEVGILLGALAAQAADEEEQAAQKKGDQTQETQKAEETLLAVLAVAVGAGDDLTSVGEGAASEAGVDGGEASVVDLADELVSTAQALVGDGHTSRLLANGVASKGVPEERVASLADASDDLQAAAGASAGADGSVGGDSAVSGFLSVNRGEEGGVLRGSRGAQASGVSARVAVAGSAGQLGGGGARLAETGRDGGIGEGQNTVGAQDGEVATAESVNGLAISKGDGLVTNGAVDGASGAISGGGAGGDVVDRAAGLQGLEATEGILRRGESDSNDEESAAEHRE